MNTIIDRQGALARGLGEIRTQFQVPAQFPQEVLAAADSAAAKPIANHQDWTDRSFVTLDPQASTDLDQAFEIRREGQDILLNYAIADVGFFVASGDLVDAEAWRRGTTIYLPDGKSSLYPRALSEGAASLLPNVDRPAVVFSTRVGSDGKSILSAATRAIIRSRAKLAYETVTPADLPDGFSDLYQRILQAETARGAERVDAPEQEIVTEPSGNLTLSFRRQLESEQQNSALSLAANLAIADVLLTHHTGLFRVMPEPDERAVRRLRHSAKALGLIWPKPMTLAEFEKTLDEANPRHVAFRAAIRRAGPRATYAPYHHGVVPWHSAMAATYAHATAPLRRLADRYVIEAAFQIANGREVDANLQTIFGQLPAVMAKADDRAAQIDRAVLDLAEAIMLQGSEGKKFDAVVTDIDERGARIQLSDPAVIGRIDAKDTMPGDQIQVKLQHVDAEHRQVSFTRAV